MNHVALVLLVGTLAGCAGEEILHGLDERQANEVIVALDERSIRATKARDDGADERWWIEVALADAARAHRVLAARDLPRVRPPGFAEVFASGSMVPTPTEEHARHLHALAGELSRTIEAIDGVVEARVHLGVPQPDPLRPGDRAPPRGAVLVKCRPAACDAVRALDAGVRALVAGAADGLDPTAVSVLIAEAPESAPTSPSSPRPSRALLALAACAALVALVLAVPSVRARLRREVTS